ncbi:Cadherin-like and tandem-95 repeat domain-containing protein [Candidatus Bealeia paramacronuclearis]|uniref:Cadherin-like and tandem-95 repeat domain-containing protein n=1 Tax=Candidatus Bealeia paramacronuclearis TaxID=1921001 RepID=A0ABZ2C5F3_9PROT|nr:Cadherin-like and tandem-95 repeat domain-containing protein [Candidatus Bealeia paramacronuclearis]
MDASGHLLPGATPLPTGFSFSSTLNAISAALPPGALPPGALSTQQILASFHLQDFTLNADGTYTFIPAKNYFGAAPTITYYISDGHGGTAQANLNINVTHVNQTPILTSTTADAYVDDSANATVSDSAGTLFKLTVTDPDPGDTHNYQISDSRFQVSQVNGQDVLQLKPGVQLDYEDPTNPSHQIALTVTAVDSQGAKSASQNITVHVTDPVDTINSSDIKVSDITLNHGTSFSTSSLINTPHGDSDDPLTFTLYTPDANGNFTVPIDQTPLNQHGVSFDPVTGIFSGTPDSTTYGHTYAFEIKATSTHLNSSFSSPFHITVTAPLVAVDDTQIGLENSPIYGNVLTNDIPANPGNTIHVTGYSILGLGTISAGSPLTGNIFVAAGLISPGQFGIQDFQLNADGTYTLTPAQGYSGSIPTITYYTSDSAGETAHANLNVNVVVPDATVYDNKDAPITNFQTGIPFILPSASSYDIRNAATGKVDSHFTVDNSGNLILAPDTQLDYEEPANPNHLIVLNITPQGGTSQKVVVAIQDE